MAGNVVSIEVLADVRKLVSGVAETNSHLGSIEGMAGKAGAALKGALAGGAVIVAIKAVAGAIGDIVNGASDLQQNIGGAEAVFGPAFASIKQGADEAATSVGLSTSEYLKMSTQLGAGLKNSGISDYAGQTKNLINLGADLSAQYGGSSKDAVDALGAAMRGEYDSLEKYGISMKQSDVDARLAAEGKDKLTGAARRQAEAEAKIAIIRDQTTSSNGAYARESDTLAGQQQRLAAQIENTKDKLGMAFLPILTKVATSINEDVIPVVSKFIDWIGPKLQAGLDTLGPVIDTIRLFIGSITGSGANVDIPWMNDVIDAGAGVRGVFDDLKAAWDGVVRGFTGDSSSGATALAAAFNPAVDLGLKARGVFDEFRVAFAHIADVFVEVKNTVSPIVSDLSAGIMEKMGPLLPVFNDIFTGIGSIVATTMDIIGSVVHLVMNGLRDFWNEWGATITAYTSNAFSAIVNVIGAAVDFIKGIFKAVSLALKGDWSGALEALTSGANAAWVKIKQAFNDGLAAVWAVIKSIGEKIGQTLSDLASSAGRMAGNVIDGIVGGISGGLGRIGQAARDMATRLWTEFKKTLGISSPSRVFMDLTAFTVDGAVLGIERNVDQLKSAGRLMGDVLSGSFAPSLNVPEISGYGSTYGYASKGSAPVINITVQVPATANQVETGREVAKALEAFYATNGGRS